MQDPFDFHLKQHASRLVSLTIPLQYRHLWEIYYIKYDT